MSDTEILQMALIGFEQKRRELDEKIAALKVQLDGNRVSSVAAEAIPASRPKRQLSAAARKRIATAQKKRWAEFHKKITPKAAVKKAVPKRKLSAAARAKLIENLKKARAARAAKRTAGQAVPF